MVSKMSQVCPLEEEPIEESRVKQIKLAEDKRECHQVADAVPQQSSRNHQQQSVCLQTTATTDQHKKMMFGSCYVGCQPGQGKSKTSQSLKKRKTAGAQSTVTAKTTSESHTNNSPPSKATSKYQNTKADAK